MHIENRSLEHFVAAIETGSLLAAAKRVHLSQPALSRSIRALEADIGVPLLTRHPRGVRPTVYGEILLRHARLLRNQCRVALSQIEELRQGREGHLRLGVAPAFQRVVPAAVARLLTTRSKLTFDLFEGTYDVVSEQVLAGDIEAAFSLFPACEPQEGLAVRELMRSDFTVAMGTGHDLARRRKVRLRELAGVPWVMVSRPPSLVAGIREIFDRSGQEPPAKCVETDSITIVKELLRSDGFVALLPREIVEQEVQAGELTTKRIPEMPRAGLAGMITREGAVLPPALDDLVAAVEEERDRRRLPAP